MVFICFKKSEVRTPILDGLSEVRLKKHYLTVKDGLTMK